MQHAVKSTVTLPLQSTQCHYTLEDQTRRILLPISRHAHLSTTLPTRRASATYSPLGFRLYVPTGSNTTGNRHFRAQSERHIGPCPPCAEPTRGMPRLLARCVNTKARVSSHRQPPRVNTTRTAESSSNRSI